MTDLQRSIQELRATAYTVATTNGARPRPIESKRINPRLLYGFVAFTVLFSFISLLVVWRIYQDGQRSMDARITRRILTATGPTNLCPGDTLAYHSSVTLSGTEGAVLAQFTTTILELNGYTLYPDLDGPVTFIWDRPGTRERDLAYPLPADIAPGRYILLVAIVQEHRRPVITGLPFTIRDDCPAP